MSQHPERHYSVRHQIAIIRHNRRCGMSNGGFRADGLAPTRYQRKKSKRSALTHDLKATFNGGT